MTFTEQKVMSTAPSCKSSLGAALGRLAEFIVKNAKQRSDETTYIESIFRPVESILHGQWLCRINFTAIESILYDYEVWKIDFA